MGLKNSIYNYIVRSNEDVRQEYEQYVQSHITEHYTNRWRHWKILMALNWHYRVKKNKDSLLYLMPPKQNERDTLEKTLNKPTTKPTTKPNDTSISKIKLPYLRGSESRLFNNKEAHYIAKDCMSYDVVSFDIFDTLICRPFVEPNDLFYIVGKELGVDSFRKIRIKAESEARNYAEATKGNREVTIYDIYKYVNLYTNIDIEKGVQSEFGVELELCFPNEKIKTVFELLKYQGKRLILVSNMYYPEDMMIQLLEQCGIKGYEKLFVSCDYQASKRTGTLFQNVLQYVGERTKVIHIGDDHEADFLKPRKYGIDSIFYKNVNKAGRQYRADGMSELISSAYSGIVNYHLHNGMHIYSKPYEYGFIYGGLYVFGYCNWIHKYAIDKGIDKIFFLSRDGKIYQDVFNNTFNDVPNEYVYWSRVANLKYALDKEHGKYYFLLRAIDDRINEDIQTSRISIKELLGIYGLEQLVPCLKDNSLTGDIVLTKENALVVKTFIHEHWDMILSIYSEEEKIIKEEMKKKVLGCKKIAIVDVGWNGTGPLGIKYLIEKKWGMNCEVHCLLAGSKVADHVANINEIQSEDLNVYMFSRNYNRGHYDVHANTNNGTNSIYFELFTQDCSPSFSGVTKYGDYIFEIPEVENYEYISEIQKGICDFSKIYKQTFEKYQYMYNISGHDAYCPFRMIIRDLYFIKRYFSEFIYSRSVGNSLDNYSFWKLGDLFDKKKL